MARSAHRLASVTIFRTPVVRTVLRWMAIALLRLLRWRTIVEIPRDPKVLVLVAPHTSYWDFPIFLGAALQHRVDAHWLGTHNLFRGPGGPLFRWLGGIPVDRTRRNGLVASVVEAFDSADRLTVGIAPEGTRFRRERWKTGFYRIAEGAGVPLWLTGIDYPSRTIWADRMITLSGEVEADLEQIAAFYRPIRGRRPEWFTPPAGPGTA
jgi:1-acyl-sn-glycerol-3-phosphate acyltransferase